MPQRLVLEGSNIDELLARVRAEHGPDAEIVHAQERLVGGVGGFFARRRYEVAVQVDDEPPAPEGTTVEPDPGTAAPRAGAAAPAASVPPLARHLPHLATTWAAAGAAHHDPERDTTMTASASTGSPLATTIYDALRESAAGGSFEDLLSVADRQDGGSALGSALAAASAATAPAAPAAAASPAADAAFRPAPYLPAAALPQPVESAFAAPVADVAAAPVPQDTPGFDELLRDLLEQRQAALRAGGLDPEPAAAGEHRPWASVAAEAPAQPAPAAAPAEPAVATYAPAPAAAAYEPTAAAYEPAVAAYEPAVAAYEPAAAAYEPVDVRADDEVPSRQRASHRRSTDLAPEALVALGLAPDSPVRATSTDERTVLLDLLADIAASAPTDLRGTAVVVGPAGPARAVARRLLTETGLSRQALLVADCDDEDLVVGDVLVGAAERCGRHGAAVVVLATGSTRPEGRAAGRIATLLGAGPMTAVVDATRDPEATRSWLAALAEAGRPVDDLAAFDVPETSVPLRLLELGHPVTWLDAAPATLGAWAAPCLERFRA